MKHHDEVVAKLGGAVSRVFVLARIGSKSDGWTRLMRKKVIPPKDKEEEVEVEVFWIVC